MTHICWVLPILIKGDNENVKLLGLILDNKLDWTAHIWTSQHKLSSTYSIGKRLRNLVSESALLNIYYFMFHLSYDVNLWRISSQSISVFRIRKKNCVRGIAWAAYHDHCKPYFIRLQILNLPSLYILYQLLEIHKLKNIFSLNLVILQVVLI